MVGGWHGVNGGFDTPRRAKEDCYEGKPVSCLEDVETQFLGIRERVPQKIFDAETRPDFNIPEKMKSSEQVSEYSNKSLGKYVFSLL